MTGARFIRFYPSDWRSGCIGMSLEQEGLYWRVCAHFYETGRRLPLDDVEAAHRLGLNPKNYRRVRNALLALGKIKRHEDGYGNDRAERELAAAVGAQAPAQDAPQAHVGPARRSPHGEHEDGRNSAQGREFSGEVRTINPAIIGRQSGDNRETIPDKSPIFGEKSIKNQWPSKEPDLRENKKDDARARRCDPNGVTFDGTAIQLDANNRAFWLEQFDGDDMGLNLALIQAAAFIQPHGMRPLYAQVGQQLARTVAEKRDRDRRYAAAAAARPSAPSRQPPPAKRGVADVLRESAARAAQGV